MVYGLFDLNIKIDFRYNINRNTLSEFLVPDNVFPDFSISLSEEEIAEEKSKNIDYSDAYCEFICVFRHIQEKILDYDGLFIHGAVIEMDNRGYMFCGRHAAGKSTHIIKWKEYFGDRVTVINGDKPIVRCIDGKFYAYGSAWCGKERLYTNKKTELYSVCFINQAKENSIIELDKKNVITRMMYQITVPKKSEHKIKCYDILDKFIKELDFYLLNCDISNDAVICAYKKLTEKGL